MTSVPGLPEAASVARLAGKRVLVVGDVMLDAYLIGDADRISPEAPVPVVRVESERRLLGGAGNVARNIGRSRRARPLWWGPWVMTPRRNRFAGCLAQRGFVRRL